jgi:hypothetical protein
MSLCEDLASLLHLDDNSTAVAVVGMENTGNTEICLPFAIVQPGIVDSAVIAPVVLEYFLDTVQEENYYRQLGWHREVPLVAEIEDSAVVDILLLESRHPKSLEDWPDEVLAADIQEDRLTLRSC